MISTLIKYKIYPLPNGCLRVQWDDLDRDQRYARDAISLKYSQPLEVVMWRKKDFGTEKERKKLERKIDKYVERLCEQIAYENEKRRLREAAPIIERGCKENAE